MPTKFAKSPYFIQTALFVFVIFHNISAWGFFRCSDLVGRLPNKVGLFFGSSLSKLPTEVLKIFSDAPSKHFELMPEAKTLLAKHGAFELYRNFEKSHLSLQQWNLWNAKRLRSKVANIRSPTKLSAFLSFLRKYVTPFVPSVRDIRIKRLYHKAFLNPNLVLNSKQIQLLEKHKLVEEFERYRKDVTVFSKDFQNFSTMRLTKNGLIVTAIVSVGLANFFGVDEWISPQENMDPSHPQGMKIEDEHAELIFLQPFPQPVLRFGGIFYAFTQGGRLERIRLLDIQNATKESGISDMTRIKLNLDRKQQRTLKFDLEKQVKKTSFQLYPFISSHSKVLELLETQTNTEVPILANKSSTLTLTAIKASKLMGNELYGEIIEVQAEESKTPNNLIRSALVPYVELSFLYRYAPSVLAVDFILPKEKAE